MTNLLKCHPRFPIDFVRGQGAYLYDASGRRFLDLESGSWAAIMGHAQPVINCALKDQIDRVVHLGVRTPNHLAEEAAAKLLALAGMTEGRCSFLSSGSEAVEFVLQAAKRTMERPLLLSFSNAYHAAYGISSGRNPSEWHHIDWNMAGAEEVEAVMRSIPFEKIGAFVFEPGGGGPYFARFPSPSLVEAIADRVQRSGGWLVINEITTGMGRTGTWFGFQHYRLQPDAIAVGKGLGNGYPVSAVVLQKRLADALERTKFYHAQSHQNNPLGCGVALAMMRLLEEEGWIRSGAETGAKFLNMLKVSIAGKTSVREVRGRGLLLALELEKDAPQDGASLQAALLEKGFVTGGYPRMHPAGTGIRLDPPMVITEPDMAAFVEELATMLV